MPCSRTSAGPRGSFEDTSRSHSLMPPLDSGRMPDSASSSSLWPLPETPAMPRISPARRSKPTLSTRVTPLPSTTVRSRTDSRTSPGFALVLSSSRRTLRPTISSASCSRVACLVGRVATISPPRMTETVSVIARISRSLWVMRTMVTPRAFRARRIWNSWSVSCGVSTPVGSSRIRMSQWRNSAFRISTRCCSPTGRSEMCALTSTLRP